MSSPLFLARIYFEDEDVDLFQGAFATRGEAEEALKVRIRELLREEGWVDVPDAGASLEAHEEQLGFMSKGSVSVELC